MVMQLCIYQAVELTYYCSSMCCIHIIISVPPTSIPLAPPVRLPPRTSCSQVLREIYVSIKAFEYLPIVTKSVTCRRAIHTNCHRL